MTLKLFSILISFLFLSIPVFAETWFVDPGNSHGATWNGTNGAAYSDDGLTGKGAQTLQYVIWGTNGSDGAASAGDTIYLRSGTYTESYGSTAAMEIGSKLNAASWEAATTISSYPGEWAILSATTDDDYVFGCLEFDSLGTSGLDRTYIVIERLGITGGKYGGIGIRTGPVKIRYCHIYDCALASSANVAGIALRRPMGCVIEYCLFGDNGGFATDNPAHIMMYADYNYSTGTFTPTHCNRDNEIAYCYFHGDAYNGIHDKAAQFLANYDEASPTDQHGPGSITDLTYQANGNKYHHNIFDGTCNQAIYATQFFEQIYNNIADDSRIGFPPGASTERPMFYVCMYNNTVLNDLLIMDSGYSRHEDAFKPCGFFVNNLAEVGPSSGDRLAFGLWYRYSTGASPAVGACNASDFDWTGTTVDRNFIHSPGLSDHYGMPNGYSCNSLTTAEFNAARGTTNYTNSTAGLWASTYVPSGSFVIGSTTIAEGGYNAAHPYLSGVTIPSYVGAVNPSDSDWVAGVLALDVTYFTSATAGSDPSWIEGSGSSPSTPTIRSGSIVNGGLRP